MELKEVEVDNDSANRLFARIRKNDHILREHFSKVESRNKAHEVRRLLEKAIIAEKEGK